MDGNGRLIVVFLFTCILKFFSHLNSGMSAAWDPATTWTLGNYSTTVDALLSEVLNVQSEMKRLGFVVPVKFYYSAMNTNQLL